MGGWKALHSETSVIGDETGYARDYRPYPYGGYEALDSPETLYPQGDHEPRRQPKERVLGIPGGDGGGIAFPFLALGVAGSRSAVNASARGDPVVVFWDGKAEGAVALMASWVPVGRASRVDGMEVPREERGGFGWTTIPTGVYSESRSSKSGFRHLG